MLEFVEVALFRDFPRPPLAPNSSNRLFLFQLFGRPGSLLSLPGTPRGKKVSFVRRIAMTKLEMEQSKTSMIILVRRVTPQAFLMVCFFCKRTSAAPTYPTHGSKKLPKSIPKWSQSVLKSRPHGVPGSDSREPGRPKS